MAAALGSSSPPLANAIPPILNSARRWMILSPPLLMPLPRAQPDLCGTNSYLAGEQLIKRAVADANYLKPLLLCWSSNEDVMVRPARVLRAQIGNGLPPSSIELRTTTNVVETEMHPIVLDGGFC
jgi:hypothetical protein